MTLLQSVQHIYLTVLNNVYCILDFVRLAFLCIFWLAIYAPVKLSSFFRFKYHRFQCTKNGENRIQIRKYFHIIFIDMLVHYIELIVNIISFKMNGSISILILLWLYIFAFCISGQVGGCPWKNALVVV